MKQVTKCLDNRRKRCEQSSSWCGFIIQLQFPNTANTRFSFLLHVLLPLFLSSSTTTVSLLLVTVLSSSFRRRWSDSDRQRPLFHNDSARGQLLLVYYFAVDRPAVSILIMMMFKSKMRRRKSQPNILCYTLDKKQDVEMRPAATVVPL